MTTITGHAKQTVPSAAPHAIVIAPQGATGSVRVLVERLTAVGIATVTVDDADTAAALARDAMGDPPVVLVDLREHISDALDDQVAAVDLVKRVRTALPRCSPVVLSDGASSALLVACVRAGAADILDLSLETTTAIREVVSRVYARQCEAAVTAGKLHALRAMIEDLLRDLIKTERRSLDLETQVRKHSGENLPLAETRGASILLIEPDRELADTLARKLSLVGIDVVLHRSGEDALKMFEAISGRDSMFDLALVAAQMPGVGGLETVTTMRERFPGLSAFLLTSVSDSTLAEQAADLGVVVLFVKKPLVGVDDMVERLAGLARSALASAREHAYLGRIKHRHERVLARYRALPRDA